MQKYTNTSRTPTRADFVAVSPINGSHAVISAKSANVRIQSITADAVSGSVRLVVPTTVTGCETACPVDFAESMELKFNILKGTDPTAIRVELLRLFDKAVAEHYLLAGLVPPTHADFDANI